MNDLTVIMGDMNDLNVSPTSPPRDPVTFDPADRWLYTVKQQGTYGAFRTDVNATKVSDFDYFRDLGSNLASSSQVQLQQYAAASYAQGGLSTRVWVQDFQRLDVAVAEPYRRLPEVDVDYHTQLLGPLAWSVGETWQRSGERIHEPGDHE